jgi:hypothetical protein
MKILAIDPGTTKSAYVVISNDDMLIKDKGHISNDELIKLISTIRIDHLVIEQIKSYGNILGDSVLETCVWVGRFIQEFGSDDYTLLPRKTIVTQLCGNPRARDKNVRQYCIDYYRELLALDNPIGTKRSPQALYGVSKDIWSALAVSLAYFQIRLT